MEKYYRNYYDHGEKCEVLDENLNFVCTVKGESVEGLIRVDKAGSITASLYETEPIGNGKYVILKNRIPGAAVAASAAFK